MKKLISLISLALLFAGQVDAQDAQKPQLYEWAKKHLERETVKISKADIQNDLKNFSPYNPPLCAQGNMVYVRSLMFLAKSWDATEPNKVYVQIGGYTCKNAKGGFNVFSEPNFKTQVSVLNMENVTDQYNYIYGFGYTIVNSQFKDLFIDHLLNR